MKYDAATCRRTFVYMSLPVRGAWVEISPAMCARTGTRPSLPVRGAWVEILMSGASVATRTSRSPCGERGLKSLGCLDCFHLLRRSPCGERGLKLENAEDAIRETKQVAPRAGSVG